LFLALDQLFHQSIHVCWERAAILHLDLALRQLHVRTENALLNVWHQSQLQLHGQVDCSSLLASLAQSWIKNGGGNAVSAEKRKMSVNPANCTDFRIRMDLSARIWTLGSPSALMLNLKRKMLIRKFELKQKLTMKKHCGQMTSKKALVS